MARNRNPENYINSVKSRLFKRKDFKAISLLSRITIRLHSTPWKLMANKFRSISEQQGLANVAIFVLPLDTEKA